MMTTWVPPRRAKPRAFWSWYRAYLNSPEWAAKRAAVLARDNYRCQVCKQAAATQVDHKTYARVGNEKLSDLRAICKRCHERKHGRPVGGKAMASNTIFPLSEASQADNEYGTHYDYIRPSQIDPPIRQVWMDWQSRAVLLLGVPAIWLLLVLVAGLNKWITCWGQSDQWQTGRCQQAGWLLSVALWTPVVVLVLWGGLQLWKHWKRTSVEAARARITRDRWSNPVDVHAVIAKDPQVLWQEWLASAAFEQKVAPHKQLPSGLDVYNPSYHYSVAAAKSDAAQITEGVDVGPLPVDVWMSKLLEAPHIMLAANSGSGKSTLARAILAPHIEKGGQVYVIDPHYQPGAWFDLPARGAGLDYKDIQLAFQAVLREMTQRYKEFGEGRTDFTPITVVIDEVPSIYADLGNDWKKFATRLGSEARKVNIRTILLTQSPFVQDIGVNTAMRKNFKAVALDSENIRKLIAEELNKDRKAALGEKFAGLRYPAAMEIDGQIWLLDRTGLDRVEKPTMRDSTVWQPSESENPQVAEMDAEDVSIGGRIRSYIREHPGERSGEIIKSCCSGYSGQAVRSKLSRLAKEGELRTEGETGDYAYFIADGNE